MEKSLVLVTGVTGYLGSWVLLQTVLKGKYRVRATLRSKQSIPKLSKVREILGDEKFEEIDFVEADLTNE